MTALIRFHDHGYGTFTPRRHIGPASWPRFDLLLIHSGAVRLRVGSEFAVEFSAGQGLLIYPDTPFHGYALTKQSLASVQHFEILTQDSAQVPPPFSDLIGLRTGFQRVTLPRPRNLSARFRSDIDRAFEWAFVRQTPLVHSLRVAQMTLILGQLRWGATPRPQAGDPMLERIDKLVSELHQHWHEQMTLADMARQLNLSPSHFRALFRRRMGMSPGRYFVEMRMKEAARRLRELETPVKHIAAQAGFSDLPNFYRTFRSVLGLTPGAYRARFAPRG